MLTLLIQTVLDRIDLVLLQDDQVLESRSWMSEKDEVSKLLPAMEEMINAKDKKWLDLKRIVVVVGRGNFSSTRIGVTVANTLALATEAAIYEMEIEAPMELTAILERMKEILSQKGLGRGLAKPLYRSEPMISLSQKKKFTE